MAWQRLWHKQLDTYICSSNAVFRTSRGSTFPAQSLQAHGALRKGLAGSKALRGIKHMPSLECNC